MLCVGLFACNLAFTYFYVNIKYSVETANSTTYEIYNTSGNTQTAKEVSVYFLKYNADVNFTSKCSGDEALPEQYNKQPIKGEEYFFITYNLDQQAELIPTKINVTLSSNTSETEQTSLEELITSLYGSDYITYINESFNWDFIKDIFMLLLIYLACIFSLLFIMTYLYEDWAYELSVYKILGATQKKIVLIMCSIQFILLCTIGILAQLFHHFLYDSFFYKISWSENIIYSISDYLTVLLLTLGFTLAFILIFLTLKIKKSVVLYKNNSTC